MRFTCEYDIHKRCCSDEKSEVAHHIDLMALLVSSHIIDKVWLYRPPIPEGQEGVTGYNDYYLPSRRLVEGEELESTLW